MWPYMQTGDTCYFYFHYLQVPVSKMNHPEDITAVAEIVLQLHT